jgi:hypothetical protein
MRACIDCPDRVWVGVEDEEVNNKTYLRQHGSPRRNAFLELDESVPIHDRRSSRPTRHCARGDRKWKASIESVRYASSRKSHGKHLLQDLKWLHPYSVSWRKRGADTWTRSQLRIWLMLDQCLICLNQSLTTGSEPSRRLQHG